MAPLFTPRYARINMGLTTTASKLPKAEWKMAKVSSPPDNFVRTVTELMVMGKQEQMTNPLAKFSSKIFIAMNPRVNKNTVVEQTPKLKL